MAIERILVIDDDPKVVRLCQRTLQKQGLAGGGYYMPLSGGSALQQVNWDRRLGLTTAGKKPL